MRPDVSVIIPTHNRCAFLPEAVASCFEGNEAFDVEVVVVDDGSTDGTREWLQKQEDARIRGILQEHQGAQVARNRGLHEATGRFVKFLDSDDVLVEGMLVEEVRALVGSSYEVAYGDLVIRDLQEGEKEWKVNNDAEGNLITGVFEGTISTIPPVLLYRREAISGVEWDPQIPYHQDTAFAIDVASRLPKSTYVGQPVAVHRWHDGERIATSKASSSRIESWLLQVRLIERGLTQLRSEGTCEDRHLKAAATGLWQWAHMLAVHDWDVFKNVYRDIERMVPGYLPRRSSALREWLDRLVGPYNAEQLMLPLRRAKGLWDSESPIT